MGRGRHRACAAALLIALAGCGESNERAGTATRAQPPEAGGNGILVYALPSAPVRLDPLDARSPGARTIAAQIFEPLVQTLHGPYGDKRSRRGLALRWAPSPDRSVWRFRLRPGVRFQDGTPFNAAAVLANAERWLSLPAGRSLLPDLIGVDAPRPTLVRFVLRRPARNLPPRLADPRLGIVSPAALAPRSGVQARLTGAHGGSGPFVLLRRAEAELELTRYSDWWGTEAGIGPALDGVRFVTVSDQRQRAGLLRAGNAQVASQFDPALARQLDNDPLLASMPAAGGGWLGFERSVRGLARHPASLSSLWLTRIGQR